MAPAMVKAWAAPEPVAAALDKASVYARFVAWSVTAVLSRASVYVRFLVQVTPKPPPVEVAAAPKAVYVNTTLVGAVEMIHAVFNVMSTSKVGVRLTA